MDDAPFTPGSDSDVGSPLPRRLALTGRKPERAAQYAAAAAVVEVHRHGNQSMERVLCQAMAACPLNAFGLYSEGENCGAYICSLDNILAGSFRCMVR